MYYIWKNILISLKFFKNRNLQGYIQYTQFVPTDVQLLMFQWIPENAGQILQSFPERENNQENGERHNKGMVWGGAVCLIIPINYNIFFIKLQQNSREMLILCQSEAFIPPSVPQKCAENPFLPQRVCVCSVCRACHLHKHTRPTSKIQAIYCPHHIQCGQWRLQLPLAEGSWRQ